MTECFRSEVVYYNRGLKMEKHVSHHVGVYINKLCVRFKRDHLLPNKKKTFLASCKETRSYCDEKLWFCSLSNSFDLF